MTDAAEVLHLVGSDYAGEGQGQLRHRILNTVGAINAMAGFRSSARSWRDALAGGEALLADIVVLHNLSDVEVEPFIESRRRRGLVTLVEISDDPAAATPWRKFGATTRNAFQIGRQLLHASLADGVQFSSSGLRERYQDVNPRTAVLENLVAFPASAPSKPDGFVIGWAGTRSHAADVAAIAPVIAAFCSRHRDATLALMGDPSLHVLFEGVPDGQRRVSPFASYEAYRAFLDGVHVGVIPLADTRFNRGRTVVKLVEMAAAGLAIAAQRIPPYDAHGDVALLFDGNEELDAHLEHLFADRGSLRDRAATTFEAIRSRCGDDVVRERHREWYASFLGERRPPRPAEHTRVVEPVVEPARHPLLPHPYNPFTLEAERRKCVAIGDYAGAEALRKRLDLVTPEPLVEGRRLARYRAFGWSIASDLPLRACTDTSPMTEPDLRILRCRPRPPGESGRAIQISGALRLEVESDTCWVLHARGFDARQRYAAEVRPRLIEVGWTDGVWAADIGANMMTAGMASHAFVSGRPCLHGSVITGLDGRTVAILGSSGAGKSTLTAALVMAGARLVSEEVIVLDPSAPREAACGVPAIKTSEDAARALGLSAQARPAFKHAEYASVGVSIGLDEIRQFQPDPSATLDGIYLLEGRHSGTDLHVSAPLSPGAAAAAVAAHGYWMSHLPESSRRLVMEAAFTLAGSVPVSRVTVPDTFDTLLAACRSAVREHDVTT